MTRKSKVRERGVSLSEEPQEIPEELAILSLRGTIFTYDEITKNGWENTFQRYCAQGLIVNYEKVLKRRIRVRGIGIVKVKEKYGIPKKIDIYTFVRETETKEYKKLEILWRRRIEWIQMVDRVNCDRVDRVIEDSIRVADRRKSQRIERQIKEEEEFFGGKRKIQEGRKEFFVCPICSGNQFKTKNGQCACVKCGIGWNIQSAGPGPQVIHKPKRKFRRVEYKDGKVLVLDKDGHLVPPAPTKGWSAQVTDNNGWLSGKGSM